MAFLGTRYNISLITLQANRAIGHFWAGQNMQSRRYIYFLKGNTIIENLHNVKGIRFLFRHKSYISNVETLQWILFQKSLSKIRLNIHDRQGKPFWLKVPVMLSRVFSKKGKGHTTFALLYWLHKVGWLTENLEESPQTEKTVADSS